MNAVFLMFFMLLVLDVVKLQLNTEWTDPISGTYYNFGGLKRKRENPWNVRMEKGMITEIYRFNFGENVSTMCHGKYAPVTENLEIYHKPHSSCTIGGSLEAKNVFLMEAFNPNAGIVVEYAQGDMCTNNIRGYSRTQRTTRFYLKCSKYQDDNVIG
jgi:hypothetical protein